MISFESDYNNGAHPQVLQHLIETNQQQSQSYGFDAWSEAAREKIRETCQSPKADVFFLVGGTQANATVIDAMLQTYEAVIAVTTGHINVHESGAGEQSGHKVITLPSHDGRMDAHDLMAFMQQHEADPSREHTAWPGMVYITFPTELGTTYKAQEIEDIYRVCRQFHLTFFIDGARLGYGLMAEGCDFDLPWLAKHCDVFYIGGTKVGALCGEAVVFPRGNAPRHMLTIIKRHGALLAKSRLAGVQFDALFTDGLYLSISRHAITMAMKLRQIFIQAGFKPTDSPTNQQFVAFTNAQKEKLMKQVAFETWEPIDQDHTLCRFVTSWATTDADLTALAKALNSIKA